MVIKLISLITFLFPYIVLNSYFADEKNPLTSFVFNIIAFIASGVAGLISYGVLTQLEPYIQKIKEFLLRVNQENQDKPRIP
jgi:hypothetical protein